MGIARGLRAPFVADGLLSMMACVILAFALGEDKPLIGSGQRASQLWQLRSIFTDRRVYAFVLFGIVNNFAFPILAAFVPTKAQVLGLAAPQIGTILAAEAVTYTLGSYLAGRLSDRWGRRLFAFVAQPLIVGACLGLARSHTLFSLSVFYAVFGLGSSMTSLMSSVMIADITPDNRRATVLGAYDAAIDLVLFMAPALALALYEPLGRIQPLLLLAGVPALLALPVSWRVQETLSINRADANLCLTGGA
ncbi:MAG TPA: MFS transporter [Anaerolineae bacterium]|nr:MFS transporter [Anaerolineae bacterium]